MNDGHTNYDELAHLRLLVAELRTDRDKLTRERDEAQAALQRVLDVIRPVGRRICDCERCACGNQGDAERVAAWDERYTMYEMAKAAEAAREGEG